MQPPPLSQRLDALRSDPAMGHLFAGRGSVNYSHVATRLEALRLSETEKASLVPYAAQCIESGLALALFADLQSAPALLDALGVHDLTFMQGTVEEIRRWGSQLTHSDFQEINTLLTTGGGFGGYGDDPVARRDAVNRYLQAKHSWARATPPSETDLDAILRWTHLLQWVLAKNPKAEITTLAGSARGLLHLVSAEE